MVFFVVQNLVHLIRSHSFSFAFISITLGDPTVKYYSAIERNEILIQATV